MQEGKLKGLWISDLVAKTGFSRVSHGILKYLTEYHDITGIGVNFKGDPHDYTFPIFPAILGGDLYGIRRLIDILNSQSFDFLFILNDIWVIDKYLEIVKRDVKKEKLPKIYVYFPVDGEYHSKIWYQHFDIVTKAFTYTEFGKRVVNEAVPNLSIQTIPHGIDLDDFYKKPGTKIDAKVHAFKDSLAKLGDPEKLFVILSAQRNQPRKKLDITMEGFSLFAKDKPETVKLYMHCGIVDASMDIVELSERYGIDSRLVITSISKGILQVPESQLNDIYNACDVGVNTSMGEGWSLTNMEHAITGAPQIVPDHSALTELYYDCGVLMKPFTKFTFDNSMQVGKLVSPEELANKLQLLYDDRNLLEELGEKGRLKFTQEKFHWSTISEQWRKVFEEG